MAMLRDGHCRKIARLVVQVGFLPFILALSFVSPAAAQRGVGHVVHAVEAPRQVPARHPSKPPSARGTGSGNGHSSTATKFGTVSRYKLGGKSQSGIEARFGKHAFIFAAASERATERAMSHLREPVKSRVTAVSMLDPRVDAPTLAKVADRLGKAALLNERMSVGRLEKIFREARGERFILFGHVEKRAGQEGGAFVSYGRNDEVVTSVVKIRALAQRYGVEVTLVGCETFEAGASVGLITAIQGSEIPGILAAMRDAATNGDFYAAMGLKDRPVFIDPARLAKELDAGAVQILRVGETRAVGISYRPTTLFPGAGSGIPSSISPITSIEAAEPDEPANEIDNGTSNTVYGGANSLSTGIVPTILFIALALAVLEYALIMPLYRIVKYLNITRGWLASTRSALAKVAFEENPKPGETPVEGWIGFAFLIVALTGWFSDLPWLVLPAAFIISGWIADANSERP